ncbi:MAG: hypothetical protein D6795_00520 [Deltaproteobacteria bacterium]|nr:MAG: hypothetical protein D6795_00520 [Deltaproteobacteria bacterium]
MLKQMIIMMIGVIWVAIFGIGFYAESRQNRPLPPVERITTAPVVITPDEAVDPRAEMLEEQLDTLTRQMEALQEEMIRLQEGMRHLLKAREENPEIPNRRSRTI